MRHIETIAAAVLALAFASCQKEAPDNVSGSFATETRVVFTVSETKAPEVVTIDNLDKFYCSAVAVNGSQESSVWSNALFHKVEDQGAVKYEGGKVWSSTERTYRFYASNAEMLLDAGHQCVRVDNKTLDVICAFNNNPSYKQENALEFKHILARVSTVSMKGLPEEATDVTVSLKYHESGIYDILKGANGSASAWSNLSALKEGTLSIGPDNDFWIIPGTYAVTVSFKDAAGSTYTASQELDFLAGHTCYLSCDADLSKQDIVIGIGYDYDNPDFTLSFNETIPAKGGETKTAPVVSDVKQGRQQVNIHQSGAHTPVGQPSIVTVEDYTTEYSEDGTNWSDTCPVISAGSLGKTETGESSVAGKIYVRVTANEKSTVKSVNVMQDRNVRTLKTLTCTVIARNNPSKAYPDALDWVAACASEFTLKASGLYVYSSEEEETADVTDAQFSNAHPGDDFHGGVISGNKLSVPSLGTVVHNDPTYRYVKATVTAGDKTVESDACETVQDKNIVESQGQTTTKTISFTLSLDMDTVTAHGGTVTTAGHRVYHNVYGKKTYSSGATEAAKEDMTDIREQVTGYTVACYDVPGHVDTENVTVNVPKITVKQYNDTEKDRSWSVTGTYDGKTSPAVTLTQKKVASWDIGRGEGTPGQGEGQEY